MKYNLINATNKDTDYIKKSKLYNIFTYADDLPKDEVMRINNYVDEHIPVEITDYKTIMCNKNKVGCLLVAKKDDGVIIASLSISNESLIIFIQQPPQFCKHFSHLYIYI